MSSMVLGRWILTLLLAAGTVTVDTLPAFSAGTAAAPAKLTWVSECGAKRKVVSAPIGLPRLLDVCGNGAPDLIVTFTGTPDAGQLRVTKFLLAPPSMPLKIEAVVRTSAAAGATGRALGYDARDTNAPGGFTMPFTVAGSAFDLDFTTSGAPASLDVIAELFEPDASGARSKPQRFRVGYAPVPSAAGMTFADASGSAALDLTTASPTVADVAIDDQSTAARRRMSARIDRLPSSQSLSLSSVSGQTLLSYDATGPADRVDLAVHNEGAPAATGRATDMTLGLEGLPTQVELALPSGGGDAVSVQASDRIGLLEVAATDGSPAPQLPPGESGVILRDTSAQFLFAARFTGLRSARMAQRPDIDVEVDSATRGPFAVDLQQASGPFPTDPVQALAVEVEDLPPDMRLRFGERPDDGARVLSYAASATTSRLTLDADNLHSMGRARRLDLALMGLPTSLDLDLGTERGVDIDAGGQRLGLLEVLLTSGQTETVPAGVDGVVLRDNASRYAFAARITGLRRVSVSQSSLDMFLDSDAGRRFRVDLEEQTSFEGDVRFTQADIDTLQPPTRLRLVESGGTSELQYSASAATTGLRLSTNTGDRARLDASIAPLPDALSLCSAPGSNVCGNSAAPANRMSLGVQTSSPAVIDLVDCRTIACTGAGRALSLSNLGVRKLELNVHTTQSCLPFGCLPEGSDGEVWLDTDNLELTGQLVMDTQTARLTGAFPNGFRANNRDVAWSSFARTETSGSITCPSGTDLDLALDALLAVDIAGYLC